jgi:hypothetical protein
MHAASQSAEQAPEQRRPQHLWPKGVSGNPRGRESKASRLARREAIIAAWAEPFGGVAVLKPAELDLLRQAAELAMIRPRSAEDQVRVANTISKIMAQVGFADRRRKREPPGEWGVLELLGRPQTNPAAPPARQSQEPAIPDAPSTEECSKGEPQEEGV